MAKFYPLRNAVPHPTHQKIGHKLWKVPVRIQVCDSTMCSTIVDKTIVLISKGPAAAANWVRDKLGHLPETSITAYGPRGGEVRRYVGWDSAIGNDVPSGRTESQKKEDMDLIFND